MHVSTDDRVVCMTRMVVSYTRAQKWQNGPKTTDVVVVVTTGSDVLEQLVTLNIPVTLMAAIVVFVGCNNNCCSPQRHNDWLKCVALSNICENWVTRPTSHFDISWLNMYVLANWAMEPETKSRCTKESDTVSDVPFGWALVLRENVSSLLLLYVPFDTCWWHYWYSIQICHYRTFVPWETTFASKMPFNEPKKNKNGVKSTEICHVPFD